MNPDKHRYFSNAKDVPLPLLDWNENRSTTPRSRADRRRMGGVATKFWHCPPYPIHDHPCPSVVDFFANRHQLLAINEQVEEEAWSDKLLVKTREAGCAGALMDLDRRLEKILGGNSAES